MDTKNRAFPILKREDIPAAVHSFGRGKLPFAEFKERLTKIAKRKGWEDALTEDWKNDKKKSKSSLDFEMVLGKLEKLKDKAGDLKAYVDVICPSQCGPAVEVIDLDGLQSSINYLNQRITELWTMLYNHIEDGHIP